MRKVTVSEAAKLLGITPDGVRMRVRRNTIEHDKDENGRLFVYVDESELVSNEVQDMSTNAYIDTLKSEVELLRNDLEGQRELLSRELEDWKEEARRKDAIIMSLTQRIPELQAPQDTPSETRESPQMAPEEPSDTHAPPEEERRSWWQRLFGV